MACKGRRSRRIRLLRAPSLSSSASCARPANNWAAAECQFHARIRDPVSHADLSSATRQERIPDVVKARKFEVVNKDGKPVAAMVATENGGLVAVRNKAGKGRAVSMLVGADGGSVYVRNKDGKPVIALVASKYGGMVAVNNKAGKNVAGMTADEDGGTVAVCNKAGKPVAFMGTGEDGNGGSVLVVNKDGKPAAGMNVDKDGGGLVGVFSTAGKPVARMAADEDGNGAVDVFNKDDETVASMAARGRGKRKEDRGNQGALATRNPKLP